MKKLNHQSGSSLIEMLIYISIVSVFLITLINFSWDVIYSKVKNTTIGETTDNTHVIIEKIGLATRNADSIATPTVGQTSQTLVINNPSGGQTTFDLNSGRLRINEGMGYFYLTSSKVNITNLEFINLSRSNTEGNIRIKMTVSHINPENKQEYSATQNIDTSFSLRPN
jgi:hypothetical protein